VSVLVGIGGAIAFGWANILSNTSASVALIGPGLVVTNIMVRNAREARLTAALEPVMKLIVAEAFKIVPAMTTLSVDIGLGELNTPTGLAKYGVPPNLNALAADIDKLHEELKKRAQECADPEQD
jgi:hypothetical protein